MVVESQGAELHQRVQTIRSGSCGLGITTDENDLLVVRHLFDHLREDAWLFQVVPVMSENGQLACALVFRHSMDDERKVKRL